MLPLADTGRRKGPAPVIRSLIAINLGVFAWQVWLTLRGRGKSSTEGGGAREQ